MRPRHQSFSGATRANPRYPASRTASTSPITLSAVMPRPPPDRHASVAQLRRRVTRVVGTDHPVAQSNEAGHHHEEHTRSAHTPGHPCDRSVPGRAKAAPSCWERRPPPCAPRATGHCRPRGQAQPAHGLAATHDGERGALGRERGLAVGEPAPVDGHPPVGVQLGELGSRETKPTRVQTQGVNDLGLHQVHQRPNVRIRCDPRRHDLQPLQFLLGLDDLALLVPSEDRVLADGQADHEEQRVVFSRSAADEIRNDP